MKRFKHWLIAFCLMMLVLTALALPALADANLLPNGSVQYVYVQDVEAFRAYIDSNGSYSSQDQLSSDVQYGNTYKIILEEPGELLFYPLSRHSYTDLQVFSDFQLKTELIDNDFMEHNMGAAYRAQVEAGTYYYRVYKNASYEAKTTVFVGFIPANPQSLKEHPDTFKRDEEDFPEVTYAIVKNGDELGSFIHRNMAAASRDLIGKEYYSKTYKFTVDRAGYLILAPLAINPQGEVRLHSNAGLSSMILETDALESTNERFDGINIGPGTYYYYGVSPYGNELDLSVYIGFIPGYSDPDFVEQQVVSGFVPEVEKPRTMSAIQPNIVADVETFKSLVTAGKPDLKDAIAKGERWGRLAHLHLEESGLLLIANYGGPNIAARLYNNQELSSRLLAYDVAKNKADYSLKGIYLDKGDYYYRISNYYEFQADVDTYFGFIPASSILKVESISLSEDLSTATVQFFVNDAYDPDTYKGLVRVVPGVVGDRSVNYEHTWKEANNDNAIESRTYIAMENGIFTARVAGNGLQSFLTTFIISGIGGREWQPMEERQPGLEMPEITETPLPETPVPETPEEVTATPEPELLVKPERSMEEMLTHIAMLEDIILSNNLELTPEPLRTAQAMEAYIEKLEKMLRDQGIDF